MVSIHFADSIGAGRFLTIVARAAQLHSGAGCGMHDGAHLPTLNQGAGLTNWEHRLEVDSIVDEQPGTAPTGASEMALTITVRFPQEDLAFVDAAVAAVCAVECKRSARGRELSYHELNEYYQLPVHFPHEFGLKARQIIEKSGRNHVPDGCIIPVAIDAGCRQTEVQPSWPPNDYNTLYNKLSAYQRNAEDHWDSVLEEPRRDAGDERRHQGASGDSNEQ